MLVNVTPTYTGPNGDWNYLFRTKLQNWVDGIIKGTKLGASGVDGLNVQKMIDGIYRSAAAGHEVTIK